MFYYIVKKKVILTFQSTWPSYMPARSGLLKTETHLKSFKTLQFTQATEAGF